MEFNTPKGIYQQIADQVRDRIATGEWKEGHKIPSLRKSAVLMGINPNTVAHAYQSLLNAQIIENRRGIGYFVMPHAREKIMNKMRQQFIEEEMPRIFRTMGKLKIGIEEFIQYYKKHEKELTNENKSENNADSHCLTCRYNGNGHSDWHSIRGE